MARRIIEPRQCSIRWAQRLNTDSLRAAHGSPESHYQIPRMKRSRGDNSETIGRGRQDQPRRSKRIKEHEVSLVEPGFKDALSATR